MTLDNIRDLLSLHEGRVAHAYQDSLGFWTIGVGHLIDDRKGGKLPERIIDALLDHDIETHTADLLTALPWVKDLDPVRYAVMVDMAFNLGVTGLLGFHNTLASIQRGDYANGAVGMQASRWARQVGSRAVRLVEMMRTGQWPDN